MTTAFLIIAGLSVAGFAFARSRALAVAGGQPRRLHSRPSYHGLYTLLLALIAGLLTLMIANMIGVSWVGSELRAALATALVDHLSRGQHCPSGIGNFLIMNFATFFFLGGWARSSFASGRLHAFGA